MRTWNYQRALITGAASGIGLALAEQLATRGMSLVLVDQNAAGLAQVAEQLRARGTEITTHEIDLADEDALNAFTRLLHHEEAIDLLINNAGVAHYGPTEEMSPKQFDRLMAVNLLAPLRLTLALLPQLLSRPQAHIVNMASIYGLFARRYTAAYHASKFGLVGFSESLRKEYRGRLGVTTVCPGFVRTNLFTQGTTSSRSGFTKEPPACLTTSAEVVAKKTFRAIEKDRGLVLVTPLAYALYYAQRYAPVLLEWLNVWTIAQERELFEATGATIRHE